MRHSCHLPNYPEDARNPNHVSGGLPAGLRSLLSHDRAMGRREVRSRQDEIRPDGIACAVVLHAVPLVGPIRGPVHAVRHVPPAQLSEDHEPESRGGGLPARLHAVPHHGAMGRSEVRSRQDEIRADRIACAVVLHAVPLVGPIRGPVHAVRHLPPAQLSEDDQSEPRGGGLPARLRAVPHHDAMGRSEVRPQHQTSSPLTGSHCAVDLHSVPLVGRQYAGLSTQCATCHLPNYQKTTNPNHVTAGFPQDCAACHTTTRWTGATFNHSTTTSFPLTGAHVPLTCNLCHASGVYNGLSTQCASCHLPNYQKTTNPNHVTAGFPQDCAACHTTTRWTGATFNHSTKTSFPLTGAHVPLTCNLCHASGVYKGLSTQCASCHLPNYQKTTNPNHVTAGFPQDCAACHTTTRWTGATFDHSARTRFPLTGAHVRVACNQCHSSGVYAGLSSSCVSCHLANYQRTTNPNHVTSGFPQDCVACHTTAQWTGATFNHSTTTTFPLTGAHLQATCTQCHSSGVYKGLAKTCVSCHLAKYQATTNPKHSAAGFPQDCSVCHSTTNWLGATFNHSTLPFPLVGKHVGLSCVSCHASGVYVGLATTCVSCHLARYQATTNPNHTTAGFPQQCDLCHTPTGWTPSSFNHGTTRFPLTGRHTSVACANCHVGGKYAGTPTDCYSCHRTRVQHAPPIRITPRRGSRPRARPATPHQVGRVRPSTTPGSRQITTGQRGCAARATPTRRTTKCSLAPVATPRRPRTRSTRAGPGTCTTARIATHVTRGGAHEKGLADSLGRLPACCRGRPPSRCPRIASSTSPRVRCTWRAAAAQASQKA